MSTSDKYETAAKAQGWYLAPAENALGPVFRNPAEVLEDCSGALASFYYNGNWEVLCAEAEIPVEENASVYVLGTNCPHCEEPFDDDTPTNGPCANCGWYFYQQED